MSYIEKMCFVNWRFRSFVQYMFFDCLQKGNIAETIWENKWKNFRVDFSFK